MKKIIFAFLILSHNNFLIAQSSNVKLLFNNAGDLRNPSFFVTPNLYQKNSLLFETFKDSISGIYVSDYFVEKDSFSTPIEITNKYSNCTNPAGVWNDSVKIVFFQTNILGNWDIAYSEYSNGSWQDTKIIEDSASDDINPSVIRYNMIDPNAYPGIVYQKNNSIYMFTKNNSIETNKILLSGSDSLKYSNPTAIYSQIYKSGKWMPEIKTTAIQTDNNQNRKIIINTQALDGSFNNFMVADEGNVSNPKYLMYSNNYLLYDKIENDITSVFLYDYNYSTKNNFKINDTLVGNFSNLQIDCNGLYIIGKIAGSSLIKNSPYMYNYQDSNNNFIGINAGYYLRGDTLINTRMINPRTAIDLVGYLVQRIDYQINYAVWEDSLNGEIKLFCFKLQVPAVGYRPNKFPINFALYQNYPNPFNPSTMITYEIPKSGLVQLKVYDVLGREIAFLVNEVQTAGKHSFIFNSQLFNKQLSSGVYIYRLKSGSYISSKKMILLK